MAALGETTVYRIYRTNAFSSQYFVALGDSDVPLYGIKNSRLSKLALEDIATGRMVWQRQSSGLLSSSVKIASPENGSLVKLREGDFFSRTARSFDYANCSYKWRQTSLLDYHYNCIRADNNAVLASFKKKFWTLTYGHVTLHNERAWPPGLKEFIIVSLCFVVEDARRRDGKAAGEAGGDFGGI
ncbi:hypothetical protein H4R34_001336 [Dimargaris verticillata]|uniref:Uncharacterized protein n=1 Tax=Dimargaris verticillata TaxID=2761393 RepID=A0A9W8B8Q8_9FUNG|nr:hypothetical protein H4R34_001336 [Dimargaris verticillata]